MGDRDQTRQDLLDELEDARRRIAELEQRLEEQTGELRIANDQRKKSEANYREIFDAATDMIVVQDVQTGEVLDINEETARATGYSREELLEMGVGGWSPPGEAFAPERAMGFMARAAAGEPQLFEWGFVDSEGHFRPTEVHLRRVSIGGEPRLLGIARDITDRKQAGELAHRRTELLEAINRVFRRSLVCETEREVANACLAVARELTGSAFGFIGEVNDEGKFDTIAISNPGWSACTIPESDAVVLIRDMEIRGLWGRTLKDQRSLIVNSPASHPDSVGLPDGHPPLTAFMGAPLSRGDETFGMIALANKESGFHEEDQQAIEALSAAFVEALLRKRAEVTLKASLREKEVLLSEVHHRVKNNLQVISSLLNLQSRNVDDPHVEEMFRESRNRVRTMALTHEQLYRSEDLARVDLGRYVRDLAGSLFRSYGVDPGRVSLRVDVAELSLPLDAAIPCGLIVNELVSNSLKHAFPDGRSGQIEISLQPGILGRATLRVSDDGTGAPEDLDFRDTDSLGLQLVTSLVEQLRGSVEMDRQGGTDFRIDFAL